MVYKNARKGQLKVPFVFVTDQELEDTSKKGKYMPGIITAKILFQILLCRTCLVYKFFAKKTRTEIEQRLN